MVDTDYFSGRRRHVEGQRGHGASVERDEKYDAGFVYAEWPAAEKAPVLEIVEPVLHPRPLRRRDEAAGAAPPRRTRPSCGSTWRRPTLMPTDGIVLDTSRRSSRAQATDLDKARAIYEWIVDNTFRDPKVQGLRPRRHQDHARDALPRRQVRRPQRALRRAGPRGRPARPRRLRRPRARTRRSSRASARSGDISKAQHCRAEVFLTDYGWVPVDPADVRKVVLEETAGGWSSTTRSCEGARKLFGGWEMNWIAYNYAHDLKLPSATRQARPS